MAKAEKDSSSRKTSGTPTLVYAYGIPFVSKEAGTLLHDQVFAGHRYYNKLIEIERKRRGTYREIRKRLSLKLTMLEGAYDRASERYNEARVRLCEVPKSKRDESPEVKEVRALRKARDEAWKPVQEERIEVEKKHFATGDAKFLRLKEQLLDGCLANKTNGKGIGARDRQRINQQVHEEMTCLRENEAWLQKAQCEVRALQDVHEARKASGCYTGVYLAIDAAALQSFSEAPFNPDFRRFDHCGRVGVQLTSKDGGVTKGTPVEQALNGGDSRIRITIQKDVHIRRASRDGRQAATLRMRLASSGMPETFIEVPFVLHRPLPTDGLIKWVYIVVNRVGTRPTYEVQFTLESNIQASRKRGSAGVLAVNVGWRVLENRDIQVAAAYDGTKVLPPIILPARMMLDDRLADDLLGYSDDHFNATRAYFKTWLKKHPVAATVREQLHLQDILRWRSHGRLASAAFEFRKLHLGESFAIGTLWKEWRTERHSLGRDLFTEDDKKVNFGVLVRWFADHGVAEPGQQMALCLEWWRRKDEHLLNWARGIKLRLQRWRREIYRTTAAAWSAEYLSIGIEEWNKSATARLPAPEFDTRSPQEERASAVRQFAGVSIFTGALGQAFGKAHVHKVNAENISRIHFGCGGKADSTLWAQQVKCSKCRTLYNQDENAAKTLWARMHEPPRERLRGEKTTRAARGSQKAQSSR